MSSCTGARIVPGGLMAVLRKGGRMIGGWMYCKVHWQIDEHNQSKRPTSRMVYITDPLLWLVVKCLVSPGIPAVQRMWLLGSRSWLVMWVSDIIYFEVLFIIRTHSIIRAKRVSNWYIPKKKSARVPCAVCTRAVCTTSLGLSVSYYVPHTYVSQLGSQDTYM